MTENKRFRLTETEFIAYILDNGTKMNYGQVVDMLNELSEENEQLKQRNNRQAKQLGNLYHLIENEDWKTLKGIIQEFQECEELLQKEECLYANDFNNIENDSTISGDDGDVK